MATALGHRSQANAQSALAEGPTEPLGGQPPPGAKQSVSDLEAQVAYQRAFEAVLWAMPASAIYRLRVGLLVQPGMADNVIASYSGPLHTFHEVITGNQVTPYIVATTDLRNGPVVVEVPAKSDRAVLYGQIVDAWQPLSPMSDLLARTKGQGANTCFCHPATEKRCPTDTS